MELTKNILKAQVYSLEQHKHKTYGEGIPYAVHIIYVVSIIQKYLHLIPKENQESAIIAGWLHDTCEDSGISYNEIKRLFGEEVAELVHSVTNEWGRAREEKAQKTLPKTALNRIAVFVKLADRIANVSYSEMTGSSMNAKYRKEYAFFKQILHVAGEYDEMWIELETLSTKKKLEASE